jgi:hypothetical protein
MRHRLCFGCFSCRHSERDCQIKRQCKQPGHRFFHHILLHEVEKPTSTEARPSTARIIGRQKVALGILRLNVQAAGGSWIPANIFADEGSDTILMRTAFASSLKLQSPSQVLTVNGAGGVINRYQSKRVQFQLRAESDKSLRWKVQR